MARSDDGYRPSYRRAVTVIPCHTQRVRPRSPAAAVTAAITVMTGAAILVGCSSEDDGSDTQRFCADVAANAAAIVAPPLTEDDVDSTLDLYRDLADAAPITIEDEMRDLLLNVETASTVVPEDPESVQRTVAVAFATEKSAVAVRNWVLTNCGVDLGPVATIAPQDPAATTTLAPDISTTLVTVVPPPTVPPPTVPTHPRRRGADNHTSSGGATARRATGDRCRRVIRPG